MKARTFSIIVCTIMQTIACAQDSAITSQKEIKGSHHTTKGIFKGKNNKNKKNNSVHKIYTDMTFEELIAAKDKKINQKDYNAALKYLEQLLKICTNVDEMALVMIEYSDLLFEQGELEKASKVYTEFTKLYPGHTKHEYALYKATMCSYYTTLSSDRDQTITENTISLAQNFLENSNYKTFEKEVTDIQQQCYKKIVKSELGICDFYLKQGNYNAAQQRVAHLKSDYIPKVPDIEADILAMELEIAEKQEATRIAQQKIVTPKTKHAAARF